MNERLAHDVAWAVSRHVMELFDPLLRDEEQREAFAEVYARVKAGIECYGIQTGRTQQRMNPSRN